jgi:hypothetical protein
MSDQVNPEKKIEPHKDVAKEDAHARLQSEAVNHLTTRRYSSKQTNHEETRTNHRAETHSGNREDTRAAFSQHGFWAQKEADYYKQGLMVVLQGDSLESIARKALIMRGASTAGPDAVPDEADRIRALNMKNPVYKYLEHSRHIEPGMVLQITEPRIGPDINTAWKPWHDVAAGQTEYVRKGERAVVQPGGNAIVEPGGAALLNSGGAAFGYQKTYIESLPRSVTVTGGSVDAAPGAAVVKVNDEAKVQELAKSREPYLFFFPHS